MVTSTFDLFKIGVGPSSSHTMGPMLAASIFAGQLDHLQVLDSVKRVVVELFGSLALTGKGHATDRAILLGLEGNRPDSICPDQADEDVARIRSHSALRLNGSRTIDFVESHDLLFNQRQKLPFHSNGMQFSAYEASEEPLHSGIWYSTGGGAIVAERDISSNAAPHGLLADIPYPFHSGRELLDRAAAANLSIADLMLANECANDLEEEVRRRLKLIRDSMANCIDRGVSQSGQLPGGLAVKRRAAAIHARLLEQCGTGRPDPLAPIDWVNLWALAVNEENAAGGRVITAPTNGAAGIVPAVLRYYERYVADSTEAGADDFLLTAAAIGSLFKENASISGAEVGCQGEVGVACSMAAAGLTAALGGSNAQIENAAEIGMEHNLGLTCDPVGGLVQIPCIERNAVGAIKAIEASRLALLGDGTHYVTLDQVIETMKKTGADMSAKYKETALGGLAVNVVEC